MPLRLYNTRTRSVETFAPLHDGRVRMYVCGLTPSAQAHVGHARSFLFFDVLRRFLIFRGYDVTYVQNVTDIDDRSINRARETGEHWYDIVSSYYASFKASMRRLGVREPDFEPYATKYVEPMIEMIAKLIETGHAYPTDDGVYYRVASFERYGALANRNIAELQSGARVDIDEKKDDPLDFALWKFAKPGEPSWPSPWGEGRPGWHIECSAMAHALLDPQGEGFDIHGGGADLIFPHHENEIAQSEPLMARPPMANFWMHGGLLLFENKKMSKSLGNFEPLSDLLERHDPLAIRLLFLQTGYRKVMNFTEESIAAAGIVLEKLKKAYRELHTVQPVETGTSAHSLLDAVERALEDDMNTSVALAELLNVAASASSLAADKVARPAIFARYVDGLGLLGLTPDDSWLQMNAALPDNFIAKLEAALGRDGLSADPQAAIDAVIVLRAQARAEKNWSESDRLRDGLLACGVELKDSKDGTTWTVAQ
jgi:cysteinyl-tRNA synthetase